MASNFVEKELIFFIHYGEIALKGKNKSLFEIQLEKNIKFFLDKNNFNYKIKRKFSRIELYLKSDSDLNLLINILSKVPGIKYFFQVKEFNRDINLVLDFLDSYFKNSDIVDVSFNTKRHDKSFNLISPEINALFGEVATKNNIKVDYRNSKNQFFFYVEKENFFLSFKRFAGLGGLPVGSVGRVLCLLSGGIDSPVAAYNMIRRGCRVDFLHIHPFPSNQDVFNSKMKKIILVLSNFQGDSKFFSLPSHYFEMAFSGNVPQNYEVLCFKNFILSFAEKLAKSEGYDAILTGDNIAQVASQTMENLIVSSNNIRMQIFRPLLCFDKEEIISIARKIGTYDLSIEDYKDCCSLVSKNPITKGKVDKFEKILKDINLKELYDKSFEKLDSIYVNYLD